MSKGLEQVQKEVARVAGCIDAAFSAQHPKRTFWVRPSKAAEVKEIELLGRAPTPLQEGHARYTIVRRLPLGARQRLLVTALEISDKWQDLPEWFCAAWYHKIIPVEWLEETESMVAQCNRKIN